MNVSQGTIASKNASYCNIWICWENFLIRKTEASQNLHKKISTHLLTVLTDSAITYLEQRKGIKRKPFGVAAGCVYAQTEDRISYGFTFMAHMIVDKRRNDLC